MSNDADCRTAPATPGLLVIFLTKGGKSLKHYIMYSWTNFLLNETGKGDMKIINCTDVHSIQRIQLSQLKLIMNEYQHSCKMN